jgi:hypothetical protein
LQKVIIISYFFPPSNFVGGERTASWAKHLADNNIYPIIVTRQWNDHQKDLTDYVIENDLQIEKYDTFEVIRLPFKKSLRDRLSKYAWLKPLQKALTLKELIFSNFFIGALPYSNFYDETRKRLQEDPSIKAVIATGRPFQSFAIGHKIKKEFDVLWIPDYRDEWNSHQNLGDQNFIERYVQRLMRKSELKWTSNADFFLTVSDTWVDSISGLIKKEGKAVYNGYVELKELQQSATLSERLIITYAGTLYPTQNLSLFLDACISIFSNTELDFEVRFIGANVIPEEELKIKRKIKGHESHFVFHDRMPRNELDQFMIETDVLYLTGFEKIKGWFPVKLFEYYATGRPLLLCPSDNDVMENFIQKTNIGHMANTAEECENTIVQLIEQKASGENLKYDRNLEYGKTFSREFQTANLAKYIHEKLKH